MEQRGNLPISGQINFELNDVQLGLLEKRLINSFKMDAIISFPDNPSESRKKIKLNILHAHSPGSVKFETTTLSTESVNFTEEAMGGLARTHHYLIDKIIVPNSWTLFGELQGDNPIPIIILFYVDLNLGTYTFKRKEEKMKTFNPQLN